MTWGPKLRRRTLAGALLLSVCAGGCTGEAVRRIGERDLRAFAVRIFPPTYPTRSIAAGMEGVAVAELELLSNGAVRSVKVLESPDSDIARELRTVLKQWQFSVPTPPGTSAAARIRGKITHYFVLDAGHGVVLTPLEKAGTLAELSR